LILPRSTFSGELNEYIENVRRVHEQIIDTVNLDTLKRAEWDKDACFTADELISDFKAYMEANRDETHSPEDFLQPAYLRREVTFTMINEVLEKLKLEKPQFSSPGGSGRLTSSLKRVNGNSPKTRTHSLYIYLLLIQ